MRARFTVPAVLALALVASACGSNAATPEPKVNGILGYDENAATAHNFPVPAADPFTACGSDTATFGTEVLDTAPNLAKVNNEWGDVVPGKQMLAVGTVTQSKLFNGDLPFTHPFGNDLNVNIKLDEPFSKLAQILGTEASELPEGDLHIELGQSEMPHSDGSTILDGFMPQRGDRMVAMGRWIIDCGHPDFHTEIHPFTFIGFAHEEGGKTVARFWYVPYYETQVYSPLPDITVDFSDRTRTEAEGSARFPAYLFQELLRIGHLGPKGPLCCADRIETHEIIEANSTDVPSFYVCPPDRKAGEEPSFQARFTTRPGVNLTGEADADTGCVRFDATFGKDYRPLTPERQECVVTWEQINLQAAAALGTPDIDIKKAIEEQVPESFIPSVEKDPAYTCYDPFVVGELPAAGSGLKTARDGGQAYPFFGEVTVSKG